MIDTLLLPLRFGFMQEAFVICAIVAVPTALLSCFLVLKGWALMGDAISHAVLPGIVGAYILGAPLILGAFAAAMVTALLTGFLQSNSRVKSDTVMGIVFAGMFGLGIVMFAATESDVHLDHILFGNMLGVGRADLILSGTIAVLVGGGLLIMWRDLMVHSFDPVQARVSGLRVNLLHYGLLTALSLTIVATLSSVGLVLAIGLLIAPGAIAFLLVRRLRDMLWVSVLVCLVAMLGGTYASFWLDSAPAPTVILLLTGLFLMALGWRRWRIAKAQRGAV